MEIHSDFQTPIQWTNQWLWMRKIWAQQEAGKVALMLFRCGGKWAASPPSFSITSFKVFNDGEIASNSVNIGALAKKKLGFRKKEGKENVLDPDH